MSKSINVHDMALAIQRRGTNVGKILRQINWTPVKSIQPRWIDNQLNWNHTEFTLKWHKLLAKSHSHTYYSHAYFETGPNTTHSTRQNLMYHLCTYKLSKFLEFCKMSSKWIRSHNGGFPAYDFRVWPI